MDSFRGRRSMHTLRKLPIARPRMANDNIKSISTGVYCGRITDLSQYLVDIIARRSLFCSDWTIAQSEGRTPF